MTKNLKNRETCAKFVRHLWQNRRFPHRISQNFAARESNGMNSVWNSNVQKLPHKMPLISFWTNGENSLGFNEEINEAIDEH